MTDEELAALLDSMPGPQAPSGIPYGAPTPGATELSTVSTPEAGPGILKEGANIAALAGQGLFSNFFDEALAVPSSVIRAGGNLLSGNAPDLAGSYGKEQQIWDSILKQASAETPIAGTIAEIGGAVVSPLNKVLPSGGLFKNILGAGAQGAIGGLGAGDTFEERVGGAASGAGIGAGTAGALGVAGKALRGYQNILKGSKEGTLLAEHGLSASAIKKSMTRDVRKAGEEAKIITSVKRLIDEGAIVPGEALENAQKLELENVELGQQLGKLYKDADKIQQGSVPIKLTETLDWIGSRKNDSSQKKLMNLLKEEMTPLMQKNKISISDAARNSSDWFRESKETLGPRGTDPLLGELKKYMALDIKKGLEEELQKPIYKKTLGDDTFGQMLNLKQKIEDRNAVLPALEQASSKGYMDTAKDKGLGLIRTSGGIGSLLAGATVASGGMTAPLLLGAAAAPLFLTPKGRMALGTATEGAGSLAGLFGNAAIKDGEGLFIKSLKEGPDIGASRLLGGAAGQMLSDAGSENSTVQSLPQASPQSKITDDQLSAFLDSLDEKKNEVAPATGEGVKPVALLQQGLDEAGITDPQERAQFLGQMAHESANFNRLEEMGSKKYLSMYEPGTRKGKMLGNTEKGDSVRFKGRGFIQLTGRANYERFGELVGEDLIANPERAADPEVAKKIAIAYWNDRVRPKVSDFSDTAQVTKLINGGYNGLADRKKKVELFSTKVETV